MKTTSRQALKQTNSKDAILKLVQNMQKGDYMEKRVHVTPIKVVLTDLALCIITISIYIFSSEFRLKIN